MIMLGRFLIVSPITKRRQILGVLSIEDSKDGAREGTLEQRQPRVYKKRIGWHCTFHESVMIALVVVAK